jgi:hypothetical protein
MTTPAEEAFLLEIEPGDPDLAPGILHFDSVEQAEEWADAHDADALAAERAKAAREASR